MESTQPAKMDPQHPASAPAGDPAFEVMNADSAMPVLLICDHASHRVPDEFNHLGLAPATLKGQHIAWDIGTANVTRLLASRLGVTAVLAGYSRLLIDCNRQPGDPTSIAGQSDGTLIPGNQNLNEAQCIAREERFFWPYQHAIAHCLAHLWRAGSAPALVSIHSFTPVFEGFERPWQVGVLWNHDPRLAVPLLNWFRRHAANVRVGDNEPYSGREIGFSVDHHAAAAGLPHVTLEIRQDLIATDAGCESWSETIGDALTAVLADPGVHKVQHF